MIRRRREIRLLFLMLASKATGGPSRGISKVASGIGGEQVAFLVSSHRRSMRRTPPLAESKLLWPAKIALLLMVTAALVAAAGLLSPPAMAQTTPSTDASLSALSVSPKDIIGFDRDRRSYEVGVDGLVDTATVSATANHAGASVAFDPPDADANTAGHQVALSAGRNLVKVTVTAEDGVTTLLYTVSVNGGSLAPLGWQAGADLDGLRAAGNNNPYGIWSDGTTMWVADNGDSKIYAYRLSNGQRDTGKEFDLTAGNDHARGIWSDGTTMWVADGDDEKIYAYRLSNGQRDTGKEFHLTADNNDPRDIWSDETTMWVVNTGYRFGVYAYTLADGSWDADRSFDRNTLLAANIFSPTGLWSDGTTMWVGDHFSDGIYAFRLSDRTRDAGRDIVSELDDVGFNLDIRGLWSNGTTMWISDSNDDEKVFAFNLPLSVSFEQASYTVTEGGNVTVTVTLGDVPRQTVIIPITAANQGDTSNSDYSLSETSVTFNTGETSKDIVFSAANDSVDAGSKSVKLGFGTLPPGVTEGITPKTTVFITDDDVPAVEVSFEHSSYEVAESDDASTVGKRENEVTVTVTLSAEPERTVDITLVPTNQGASNSDYSLSATSLTFGPTETEQAFTFTAEHDSEDDDDESVELSFGALPDRVNAGTTPKTVVSINDDDVPAVEVSFGSATYPVDEGETETVTVTLSAAPEREVVVPIDTTDEGGASSDDYSLSETSVTFGPTETSKTFTFTAADDAEDDDGESVKLTFGSALPAGVSRGSVPETTVSINDDDVPAVEVSFGSATYPVDEGETETVTVTLSAAPEREVVVPIDTTDEGGASSDDYSLSETSVTFGPTETSKTFTFTAADDAEDDDGESVKLTFGSALPAGVSSSLSEKHR